MIRIAVLVVILTPLTADAALLPGIGAAIALAMLHFVLGLLDIRETERAIKARIRSIHL